jgi:hypothetical protein
LKAAHDLAAFAASCVRSHASDARRIRGFNTG